MSVGTVEVIQLIRKHLGLGLKEAKDLVDRCVFDGETVSIPVADFDAAKRLLAELRGGACVDFRRSGPQNVHVQKEKVAIAKWRRGHEAAARRQLRVLRDEGPDPRQAVAEAASALDVLESAGLWPGPRDAVSERAVEQVRRRWALVERRARELRSR